MNHRYVMKISKVLGGLLCAVIETLISLFVFSVGISCRVLLVGATMHQFYEKVLCSDYWKQTIKGQNII